MVVLAPAAVEPAAQQFPGRDTGQAQALAAQVRMIGVAHLRSEVGHPSVGHRPASRGLRESEIALEVQGSLQDLRAHAHGGQEPASQLAGRDRELRAQRADLDGLPRHQPAHRLRDERIRLRSAG